MFISEQVYLRVVSFRFSLYGFRFVIVNAAISGEHNSLLADALVA